MKFRPAVLCTKCQQPIASEEGFVCFKIPRKEGYQLFHRCFRDGNCWESHLKEHKLRDIAP